MVKSNFQTNLYKFLHVKIKQSRDGNIIHIYKVRCNKHLRYSNVGLRKTYTNSYRNCSTPVWSEGPFPPFLTEKDFESTLETLN